MHLFWCGAAAGVVGQTIAYPLDVVRRRMQVYGWAGSGDMHYTHNYHRGTFIDAIRIIKHEEGYRGLYRGIGQSAMLAAAAAAAAMGKMRSILLITTRTSILADLALLLPLLPLLL